MSSARISTVPQARVRTQLPPVIGVVGHLGDAQAGVAAVAKGRVGGERLEQRQVGAQAVKTRIAVAASGIPMPAPS